MPTPLSASALSSAPSHRHRWSSIGSIGSACRPVSPFPARKLNKLPSMCTTNTYVLLLYLHLHGLLAPAPCTSSSCLLLATCTNVTDDVHACATMHISCVLYKHMIWSRYCTIWCTHVHHACFGRSVCVCVCAHTYYCMSVCISSPMPLPPVARSDSSIHPSAVSLPSYTGWTDPCMRARLVSVSGRDRARF